MDGLRHQRQRRHQAERSPAFARQALGGAQRGQRLAGAAGHDELAAAAGRREAVRDLPDGVLLVRPENRRPADRNFVVFDEMRPVDRARTEIVQSEAHDRDGLRAQRVLEIDGPVTPGGVDDDAAREGSGAGRRQEGVDRRFGDGLALGVELALDRGQAFAARELGHQVDAGIRGVAAMLPGPVREFPGVAVLEALFRVVGQEGDGEPLEGIARRLRPGEVGRSHVGAPALENGVDCRIGHGNSWKHRCARTASAPHTRETGGHCQYRKGGKGPRILIPS